jgi:formiminotetrahydrofolate cyclodeaminase
MGERAVDLSVGVFLDRLAAETPTPGGGSAAALAGALAAALVSMVCRYTLGRERFQDVQETISRVLERAEQLRAELTQDIQRDIDAYGSYARAVSLPRGTPEERRTRSEALQAALRASTEVPLDVAARCPALLRLAADAAAIGNPNLISDAAVAAELAEAARRSAALNVRLNLRGIKDAAFVEWCTQRLAEIEQQANALRDRAVDTVLERSQ